MGKYIIYESALNGDARVIQKGNVVRFVACLIDTDVKNRNGRVYPKPVIIKALENPIFQDTLNAKRLFCEMGHPLAQNIQRQTTIDPTNICAVVLRLWWEDNKLMGELETTDTHYGHDLAGLIRQGCQVAFSMRAEGRVTSMGDYKKVEDGLVIVGWDMVVVPSHENAHLMNIISEQSMAAMCNYNLYNNQRTALMESMSIAENGLLLDAETGEMIKENVDYTKSYLARYKGLSQAYQYDKEDKAVRLEESSSIVVLENKAVTKRVVTEDYLTKMARQKLFNESIVGLAPVHSFVEPAGPSLEPKTFTDKSEISITDSMKDVELPKELKDKSDEEVDAIVSRDVEKMLESTDLEKEAMKMVYSAEYYELLEDLAYDRYLNREYLKEEKERMKDSKGRFTKSKLKNWLRLRKERKAAKKAEKEVKKESK